MRPAMAAAINFTFMEFYPSLVRQQISFLPDRGESYRTESVWCKGNCCVIPKIFSEEFVETSWRRTVSERIFSSVKNVERGKGEVWVAFLTRYRNWQAD